MTESPVSLAGKHPRHICFVLVIFRILNRDEIIYCVALCHLCNLLGPIRDRDHYFKIIGLRGYNLISIKKKRE